MNLRGALLIVAVLIAVATCAAQAKNAAAASFDYGLLRNQV